MSKITIVSDFDGTISLHELGVIILKKIASNEWEKFYSIAGGGLDFIVDYCLTRNKIFNIPYVVPQIKLDSRGATLLPPNKIVVNFGHSNFKMDLIDGITYRSFNDFEEVKNFLICN